MQCMLYITTHHNQSNNNTSNIIKKKNLLLYIFFLFFIFSIPIGAKSVFLCWVYVDLSCLVSYRVSCFGGCYGVLSHSWIPQPITTGYPHCIYFSNQLNAFTQTDNKEYVERGFTILLWYLFILGEALLKYGCCEDYCFPSSAPHKETPTSCPSVVLPPLNPSCSSKHGGTDEHITQVRVQRPEP